jgi:RNA polymerase sigma-70 factor, ECF subfamily
MITLSLRCISRKSESFGLFIRYLGCMEAVIREESVMTANQPTSQTHIQSKNLPAAEELYLQHHEHIFRFIWSRVHDALLAEDLTGEVFIRMVANLPNYRDRSLPFRAWLYQIARNLIIDYHRKEASAQSLKDVANAHTASPEENVEVALTLERVQQTLEKIDPAQREVVELRFLAELSLEEVAEAMDKSVAAVKALQHRGLASLRTHLKD